LQRGAIAAEQSGLRAVIGDLDRKGASQATACAGDDHAPPGQRLIGCHAYRRDSQDLSEFPDNCTAPHGVQATAIVNPEETCGMHLDALRIGSAGLGNGAAQ
jgi:hypothetical protein